MTFILLSAELVESIHDAILNPGELPGRARDKSLEGALARVDNRILYGMIEDAFDLAAAYAIAIAQGHCFNDGNKRTAHQSMDVCLDLNGVQIGWNHEDVGQTIIRAAQRLFDEAELAEWLRQRAPRA
ncbi:type II toxin-antitoxin system death-on-curing family toxin [Paragemmobacter straminiformis]|uniref:Type II toxin-antitoxin system death-on-curing family toxin n=1 Tax=Paragemmobacter straminiformis TaxID=2045119 RepID=A0A842IC12_9RHOB|nr:type II toxin-antitoxin system death-on-curing family toxin [Gemmobacter straminiformis]MBC2837116.1 type II toxin-antitoxin system death-on-curing family toxin [Gemmobacter straminiformis]